ncbi:hypothetical protein OC846_004837 [Tilletia horrida]|uniref:MMS19 nucleotide excision repair protein n=1 Tax=Tilletia horrida TaxID=155126 RepID=A0AAN6GMJ8_9BASI|nr:hypothetical protein OC846_004837 [Tilletia horrida]
MASDQVEVEALIDRELAAYFQDSPDTQTADSASTQLPDTLTSALLSSSPTFPLLTLVRKLGPQLTHEDPFQRAKAVALLADIIDKQPPANLNAQTNRTLSTFFIDKLEDAVSVLTLPTEPQRQHTQPTLMIQSTLAALLTLSTSPSFPAASLATPLAQALTTHVPPTKHLLPQAQRFLFFRLFDALLARHRSLIFKQNATTDPERDILAGYVKFAEGEKDPRNLVYAFAIDWVILTEFDLSPKVIEAFFDITFCYFPITFRPPPSDPYGITTEQLKSALSRALTSTPHFYSHLFPLVLEKLSASPLHTKLDCLHLLADAIPVWGRAAVSKSDCSSKLWNVLETEIMHPSDGDSAAEAELLTNAAVNTLSVLLRTMYSADPAPERQWPQIDPPAGLAPAVVAKASSHLREPASALAPRAAKYLLGACIRADRGTAYLAAFAACDVLLPIFKDPEEGMTVRAPVLRCLSDVVRALRTAYEEDAAALRTASSSPSKAATPADRTTSSSASSLGFKFDAPTSSTAANPRAAPPQTETNEDGEQVVVEEITTATNLTAPLQRRTYINDNRPLHPFRLPLLSALSTGLRAPVVSSSSASGGYRASAMNLFVNLAHIEGFFTLGGLKPRAIPQPAAAGEGAQSAITDSANNEPMVVVQDDMDEDEDDEGEKEENELEWGVREITASLTQTGPTLEWSSGPTPSAMDIDDDDDDQDGGTSTKPSTAEQESSEGALEPETSAQIVTRQAAILALQEIRTIPPAGMGIRLLEVDVIPQIFNLLPDRMSWPSSSASSRTSAQVPRTVELQRRAVRTALSAITALCDGDAPALCELAVVRLCTKIELAGSTRAPAVADRQGSAEEAAYEENVAYVRGLLSTLSSVLAASAGAQVRIVALGRLVSDLPTRLVGLILRKLSVRSSSTPTKGVLLDPAVIRQTGELLVVLGRAAGQAVNGKDGGTSQFELASKLEGVFVGGKADQVFGSSAPRRYDPLGLNSEARTQIERDTLFLYAACAVPFSSAIPLPIPPQGATPTGAAEALASWLEVVLRFIVQSTTSIQADAGYALLVCALNKYATSPLSPVVQGVLDKFWSESVAKFAHQPGADAPQQRNVKAWERILNAWAWASKALLSRGGANASEGLAMLDRMMEGVMCADVSVVGKEVQRLAATSLSVVTRTEDGILTKENGAVVRPLARQRLFSHLLPKLIDGYKAGFETAKLETGPSSSSNGPPALPHVQAIYLTAFTSILPHLPRQLLKERMRSLFPLLIRSLDLPDPASRASAAKTVTYAAGLGKKEKEVALLSATGINVNDGTIGVTLDLVQEYVNTLVERLLGMLEPRPENTPNVRMAALKCLATLARTVPHISIHKLANRVLRSLAAKGRGIDDPKRQVRVEAVDAREAFFVLAASKG